MELPREKEENRFPNPAMLSDPSGKFNPYYDKDA